MTRSKQNKKIRNDGNRTRGPAGKEPREVFVPPGQRRTSTAPGVAWRPPVAQGGGGRRSGKGKRRHEVEEDFEEDEHYLGAQPMHGSDDHDGSGDECSEEEENEANEDQNYGASHGYGQTQASFQVPYPTYPPIAHLSPPKKRTSKTSQAVSPSAQFKAQMAQKDAELQILRGQLTAM